jgi:hypothetical protein
MQATLPIEVYETFEKGFGKEDAKKVVRSIETTITELTEYKWKTTKDEILEAMRKEFATKADLQLLEQRLEDKLKLYFVVLLFVIILANPRAIDLIERLLGFVK